MNIDTTVNRAHRHAKLAAQLAEKFWLGEGSAKEIDEAYMHARAASAYFLNLRELSRGMPEPMATREGSALWKELSHGS